jgi:hypothetical protein
VRTDVRAGPAPGPLLESGSESMADVAFVLLILVIFVLLAVTVMGADR